MQNIRQGLISLYRRNKGRLTEDDIAHIVWAITADACKFFSTVCDRQDIEDGSFSVSGLATIQSQILSNQEIHVRDTPRAWLTASCHGGPALSETGGGGGGEPSTCRRVTGETGSGDDIPGGRGGGPPQQDTGRAGLGLKRQGVGRGAADNVYNDDMHPAIANMMSGFHEQ